MAKRKRGLRFLLSEADVYVEPWLEISLISPEMDQIIVELVSDKFVKLTYYKYVPSNMEMPWRFVKCKWIEHGSAWQDEVCKSFGLDPDEIGWRVGPGVKAQLDRMKATVSEIRKALNKYT